MLREAVRPRAGACARWRSSGCGWAAGSSRARADALSRAGRRGLVRGKSRGGRRWWSCAWSQSPPRGELAARGTDALCLSGGSTTRGSSPCWPGRCRSSSTETGGRGVGRGARHAPTTGCWRPALAGLPPAPGSRACGRRARGGGRAAVRDRRHPLPAAGRRMLPEREHVHHDACRCDGTRKTIPGWEYQFLAAAGHLRTAVDGSRSTWGAHREGDPHPADDPAGHEPAPPAARGRARPRRPRRWSSSTPGTRRRATAALAGHPFTC